MYNILNLQKSPVIVTLLRIASGYNACEDNVTEAQAHFLSLYFDFSIS